MFGTHVWRRDPPCARCHNKEYLLNSLPTIESSIPAFHSIRSVQLLTQKERGSEGEEPTPSQKGSGVLLQGSPRSQCLAGRPDPADLPLHLPVAEQARVSTVPAARTRAHPEVSWTQATRISATSIASRTYLKSSCSPCHHDPWVRLLEAIPVCCYQWEQTYLFYQKKGPIVGCTPIDTRQKKT